MKNAIKILAVTGLMLVITLASCSNGGSPSGNNSGGDSGSDVGTFLNGTWKNAGNYGFVLNGNTWTFFDSGEDVFKGTWKCSVKPAAGISGATLTLTVTHMYTDSWVGIPSEYNSIKTNTAKLAINSAGNQMTINEPKDTTTGVLGLIGRDIHKAVIRCCGKRVCGLNFVVYSLSANCRRIPHVVCSANNETLGVLPNPSGVFLVTFGLRYGLSVLQTGRLGLETARFGLETGRLGLQTGRLGLQTARLGLETGRLGLQTARHGLETARLGLETARLGLQTAQLGLKSA